MSALLALPPELLHELLVRMDPPALRALSLTCRAMRRVIAGDGLWRALLERRFRTRAPTFRGPAPRTLRDVYIQWHRQARPPTSRLTGPNTALFAKSRRTTNSVRLPHLREDPHGVLSVAPTSEDALVWVTVKSADDCRVGPEGLVLRVVIQNIASAPTVVVPHHLHLALTTGRKIHARQRFPSHAMHPPPLSPPRSLTATNNSASGGPASDPNASAAAVDGQPLFAAQGGSPPTPNPQHMPFGLPLPIGDIAGDMPALFVVQDDYIIDRVQDFLSPEDKSPHNFDTRKGGANPYLTRTSNLPPQVRLEKDDFLIIYLQLRLTGVVHEVDAIEQLDWLCVPTYQGSSSFRNEPQGETHVRAIFDERVLWERYELMPGGWWVRREVTTTSTRFDRRL